MKKILLAAIAASALMASGIGSATAQSLDGAYAGVAGGYAIGAGEAYDATGVVPGVVELGADGLDGEVFGGYGVTLDGGFYVGIEGAVGYSDINHATTLAGLNIKGETKEGAAIYGRLGYSPSEATLLYGIAGLSYTNWDFTDAGTTYERGVTSYKVGFGAEQSLGDNMFARVSTDWDIARDPVRVNDVGFKPVVQTSRIGIGFHF